jgi:hypothetical protein
MLHSVICSVQCVDKRIELALTVVPLMLLNPCPIRFLCACVCACVGCSTLDP